MKIYLAASLFTQTERTWNRSLATAITKYLPTANIILPQDFKPAGKYNEQKHYGSLFRLCLESLQDSDIILAVTDGTDVDSGVSWEMGYAYALNKPIVAIRTDYRPGGTDQGINIMLSRSCRYLVKEYSFQEDISLLAKAVARKLRLIKLSPLE